MDPKHVSLLWALAENAAELAELHAELFADAWDQEAFLGLLEQPGATPLLARASGHAPIAGFIFGQIAADEAEIITVGVRKAYQRHGCGRFLVEGLIRSLQKAEVRRLFLEVAADNEAALGLYKGLGFAQTGLRPAYYKRTGASAMDALTLTRDIG